jgi:hypothetical protein
MGSRWEAALIVFGRPSTLIFAPCSKQCRNPFARRFGAPSSTQTVFSVAESPLSFFALQVHFGALRTNQTGGFVPPNDLTR